MRASRLLSLLMLLQSRGRASATTLAEALGVSVRTVHRDIDELSASGVPVVAERGAAGGFSLLEGWRTRLTGLTADEAKAVLLSGAPGPAKELGLADAMATAQWKLLAAMPEPLQADAREVAARFHLDPVGWYREPPRQAHLAAVSQAVWNEQRLAIRYDAWKGEVDRVIEPLGLVLKAGEWYVVAQVERKPRTYRLASILSLVPRPGRFKRPRRFDLAAFWGRSLERFEAGLYQGTAKVRATAAGLKRLRGLGSAVARALDGIPPPPAGATTVVTIPIESVGHAASQLIGLGSEIEVLEPAALRTRLFDDARAVAERYATRSTRAAKQPRRA